MPSLRHQLSEKGNSSPLSCPLGDGFEDSSRDEGVDEHPELSGQLKEMGTRTERQTGKKGKSAAGDPLTINASTSTPQDLFQETAGTEAVTATSDSAMETMPRKRKFIKSQRAAKAAATKKAKTIASSSGKRPSSWKILSHPWLRQI